VGRGGADSNSEELKCADMGHHCPPNVLEETYLAVLVVRYPDSSP